jgi:WbqC-like protein
VSSLPALTMLVSIHQPHYLPWLRYFDKIARSDLFIVLDDVQYTKNGFQNRNKIKTAQGWTYLTVPIQKPTQRSILEIEIDNRTTWRDKHRRTLEMSYRKAPYFERYWPEWAALYEREWTHLAMLNRAMLMLLLRHLELRTPVVFSSDLPAQDQATERLAALCRAVGGDSYLSGRYAVEAYLDPAVLEAAGIRLAFQEWQAPTYGQLYPAAGFVPDLAIVDLLFNTGPCAREILWSSGSTTWADGCSGVQVFRCSGSAKSKTGPSLSAPNT